MGEGPEIGFGGSARHFVFSDPSQAGLPLDPALVQAPEARLSANREGVIALPERLGPASIEVVESRSILTRAGGFTKRYKFTLNPYGGCGFGCEYCYARFFAPDVERQANWGTWVTVKRNAVRLLRRAQHARSKASRIETDDAVYMSTVTDPYQPIEREAELTRAILEELINVQPRLTVQTRSPIVTRDIDLLLQFRHVRVNFTVTTDTEAVRLRYEPRCPNIEVRLKAAEELARAGVAVGISISPMLPIADAVSFGHRIASLDAAEYVTQYLKPVRGRFSAGSTIDALGKMDEDGWTEEKYRQTRSILSEQLGPRRLLEGVDGYAPAGPAK